MALHKLEGGRMIFRGVEKNGLSFGVSGKGAEKGIGDFRRFGEKRTDLEPGTAGADHAETVKTIAIEITETEASGGSDPPAEEYLS